MFGFTQPYYAETSKKCSTFYQFNFAFSCVAKCLTKYAYKTTPVAEDHENVEKR